MTASRLQSRAALALAGLVLALAAAAIPLLLLSRQSAISAAGQTITFLPVAAVGYVVARHQPRNPIGWLLLGSAISELAGDDGEAYVVLAYRLHHPLPLAPVAVLVGFLGFFLYVTLPPVVLLFPDGTLPSRRWRPVLWAYLTVNAILTGSVYAAALTILLRGHLQVDSSGGLTVFDNPSGQYAWLKLVHVVTFPVLVAFWIVFIARLLLSWRRAGAERRQQLKWLFTGCGIGIAAGVLSILVGLDSHAPGPLQDAASIIDDLGLVALAAGVGVAILRYRLYDIDRIISRTLAYAIVTGLLLGLYAGLVLLATQVLTLTSQVAVAAATLAAAALFNPLRRRVQRGVDRRFNRARYDADNTVAAFAARLQDATDPDAVCSDLIATIHGVLEPAHLSLVTTSPVRGSASARGL
jgi:hypothetical protein